MNDVSCLLKDIILYLKCGIKIIFFVVFYVLPIPYSLIKSDMAVMCHENKKMYRDVLIYRKNYTLTELDRCFIEELNLAKRIIL